MFRQIILTTFVLLLTTTFVVGLDDAVIEAKIVNLPENFIAGDITEAQVTLFNSGDELRSIEIFSHFYIGRDTISYGWLKNKWVFGERANKQIITLDPKESYNVVLKNRISDEAYGKYFFHIKTIEESKKYDFEQDVYIRKKVNIEGTPTTKFIMEEPSLTDYIITLIISFVNRL